MIPANLIINADDFGLDPGVSREIYRCVQEGLVNSVSVLPFHDPGQEALLRVIAREHPDVRIGAHLSLIGTRPLLAETPRFAPDRASAADYREFLGMYLRGRLRPHHARAEWRAQIDLLAARIGGVSRIAHLDSHQHLHVLPGLWPAARSLREELGIPRLRVPHESVLRAVACRFPFGLAFQALARARRAPGDPGFLGFLTSTRFTVEGNLRGLAEVLRRPERVYELMVHPAPGPGAVAGGGEAALGLPPAGRETEELRLLQFFFQDAAG